MEIILAVIMDVGSPYCSDGIVTVDANLRALRAFMTFNISCLVLQMCFENDVSPGDAGNEICVHKKKFASSWITCFAPLMLSRSRYVS